MHPCKPSTIVTRRRELAAEQFDVLVSDLGLPDGTGYDLMKQIRHRPEIKGIALSGYGMEEDVRQSSEAGFAEHLVKPVDLAKLRGAIDRALDAHQVEASAAPPPA